MERFSPHVDLQVPPEAPARNLPTYLGRNRRRTEWNSSRRNAIVRIAVAQSHHAEGTPAGVGGNGEWNAFHLLTEKVWRLSMSSRSRTTGRRPQECLVTPLHEATAYCYCTKSAPGF